MMQWKSKLWLTLVSVLLLIMSCENRTNQESKLITLNEYYQTQFFKDVQLSDIFEDSKTFVDCIPKRNLNEILEDYEEQKGDQLELESYILENFELPANMSSGFVSDTSKSMSQHIRDLWAVLSHSPDNYNPNSSHIPLPNPYIVPGGRFREIYYWDSYFTLLGLMISDQEKMAVNMVNNFSFLIDTLGFIPNGNRAYYRGRSQPPFFSLMVKLIASDNRDLFISYHNAMVKEYKFWMASSDKLSITNNKASRVVMMPDSSILNRYWDEYDTPRPESFKPDYELVLEHGLDPQTTYRHLRAGAESGWDYSSRWFKDHKNLSTIHTTDIIPIDLNSLLYHLELMIAQSYNWQGKLEESREYLVKAENRKNAINKYLWDNKSQFFIDYDFVEGSPTGVLSLAAAYPMFFNLASKSQAKSVQKRLEDDFLMKGGFVTTVSNTGQQWDAPNGWAPLQWITINGLYNYGYDELGNTAAQGWLKRNNEVYKSTGKMMEKYNVEDIDLLAGGGEYALQDGFGWTNGVALALERILLEKQKVDDMTIQD